MKIELTQMDSNAFWFRCEGEGGVPVLTLKATCDGRTAVLSFDGNTGRGPNEDRWDEDNCNPRRQSLNTITLARLNTFPFVRAAREAASQRVTVEFAKMYEQDHNMLDALREIYEYQVRRRFGELKAAIAAADPTDKHGEVWLAARRYAELEPPTTPDNPLAYRVFSRKVFEERMSAAPTVKP